MARILFSLFIFSHAMLHLLGFVKGFRLHPLPQFSGKAISAVPAVHPKIAGTLWLVACITYSIAAVIMLEKIDWWWMVALLGLMMSQILIFLYWRDARFGTIANVVIAIAMVPAYGLSSFHRMNMLELQGLLPQMANSQTALVTEDGLTPLPIPVQKWLRHSGIVGKENISSVHLKQRGEMRTAPDGKWMPVSSEQYYTTMTPGFLWFADVHAAPVVHLAGRDKYLDGHGQMVIKLAGLYPVADSKGPETDQGTLQRYLSEIIWFPSAALASYIKWQPIDSLSAKATMTYRGVTGTAIFHFTPDGDFKGLDAKRYYDRKSGPTLEYWHIDILPDGYEEFEGIRIPTKASVTWRLNEGDFTWFNLIITNIWYNGKLPVITRK